MTKTRQRLHLGSLCSILVFGSCSISPNSTQSPSDTYSVASPPAYMQQVATRQHYLVQHYWDHINLADSALMNNQELLEGLVVDYLGLLSELPDSVLDQAAVAPLEHLHGAPLSRILSLYRKYLYEPDSPLEDERLFRPVLEWASLSPRVDAAYQEEAKALLKVLKRNAPGTVAAEFVYSTPEGTLRRLSNVLSPLTLVVFGTRGCPSCQTALSYILNTPIYRQLGERNKLHLLHIYVQDDETLPVTPIDSTHTWIETGRDHQGRIILEQLYDVKASPTLYLLDKDKRVLLKDPKLPNLTNYLSDLKLP